MSSLRRLLHPVWLPVLLVTVLAAAWVHGRRVAYAETLTRTGAVHAATAPESPTGREGGVRLLIAPGANHDSYQWLVQTQQMLAAGSWRVRQADYDNAPVGRRVDAPAPYRWWLALAGWVNHLATGQSLPLAIERAALWADPALHLLALIGGSVFALWRFGPLAGALLALGMAFTFPFSAAFVAGAPEDIGLTQLSLLAGLLVLLAGMRSPAPGGWFAASGAWAGFACWLNPSSGVPFALALAAGAGLAAWAERWRTGSNGTVAAEWPWRCWGCSGSAVIILGYLVEFAPNHLSWTIPGLREVHPVYAVLCLGLGELAHRIDARIRGGHFAQGWRGWLLAVLALAGILTLPAATIAADEPGFLAAENFAARLAAVDGTVLAENFRAWAVDGLGTLPFWATVLPAVLVFSALARIFDRSVDRNIASTTAVLLLPAWVAFGFACARLSWWGTLDVALLGLVAAMSATPEARQATKWQWGGWTVSLLVLLLPAIWLTVVRPLEAREAELAAEDLQSLAERDVALWLARRTGGEGAVVLAPPSMTASLIFHGGLRGLGSPYRENHAGFGAAVRIAAATSADEGEALSRQRTLTHIVMPSWDAFLDEYARLGTNQVENTLVGLLHTWLPPRWLAPVPYAVPALPGLGGERVNVFEVTDAVQDPATSWSRLAHYFVEMGDLNLAAELCRAIAEKHAEDFGGLVAIGRTELALNQRFLLARTLDTLEARIDEGSDEALPWDLRVSLVILLAAGERLESAGLQADLCLDNATENDLRRLSAESLHGFAVVCHKLGRTFAAPEMQRWLDAARERPSADPR